MSDRPTVSVLLPAYNLEDFVDEAVRSVVAQTFPDWEIVAVDDASSDGTYDRLREWSTRDPRVRPFRNEKNRGMTGNWNRALELARGTFVLKLDADDALRPRTLEILVSALRDPSIIGAGVRTLLCSETLDPIDGLLGDDAMIARGIDPYADQERSCRDWFLVAAHGHQLWHSCAIMLRRDDLTRLGGYDERFGCASDTELIWRVLEQPASFAHRAYVGVFYRVRQDSVSRVFREKRWLVWEGVAANLLSLDRFRKREPLPRALRLRFAELWQRWDRGVDARRDLSDSIRDKLNDVIAHVGPPTLADRTLLAIRKVVNAVAR